MFRRLLININNSRVSLLDDTVKYVRWYLCGHHERSLLQCDLPMCSNPMSYINLGFFLGVGFLSVHELSTSFITIVRHNCSGILRSWLRRTRPYESAHISQHYLMHSRTCILFLWKHHSHCQHLLLSNTWWSCPCYTVLVNLHGFGVQGPETSTRKLDYPWTLAR